jgi:hypothetical protein
LPVQIGSDNNWISVSGGYLHSLGIKSDGTLWAEQPLYFQALFALDRVKALAPQHPEWKDKEPFASLLKGDVKGALATGSKGLGEIVMTTHAA